MLPTSSTLQPPAVTFQLHPAPPTQPQPQPPQMKLRIGNPRSHRLCFPIDDSASENTTTAMANSTVHNATGFIQDPTLPATHKAREWLLRYPLHKSNELPKWRMVQQFALVTLYHAFTTSTSTAASTTTRTNERTLTNDNNANDANITTPQYMYDTHECDWDEMDDTDSVISIIECDKMVEL